MMLGCTPRHSHRSSALGLLAVLAVSCGDDGAGGAAGTSASSSGATVASTANEDSTTASVPVGTTDGGADEDPDTGATTATPAVCGDGVPEGLEECDDANRVNGDGCDNDCTVTFDTSIWQIVDGGAASVQEAAQGVAVGANDDIVIAGTIVDVVGDPDIYLRKVDSAGVEIWTVQLDPSVGGEDRAYAVAIDARGNIAATGETDGAAATSDIWVAMFDGDGAPLWSTTIDGPAAGNDGGRAVAFDGAGNVAVTGLVRAGDGNNDIWIGVYDATGAPLWTDTVAGPNDSDDRGRGVAFDDAGALYVGGFVTVGSFNRDVWLRKYDAAGQEDWTIAWDSNGSADDAGFALARMSSGNLVVAGSTPVVANNQDFWVATFEPDAGDLVWWKQLGAPAILNDNALGVAVDSMDNVLVVGFKGVTVTDTDIWMHKLDETGLELWSQSVFGDGLDNDEARAVAIDSEDNVIVAGEIRNAASNDGDLWVGKFASR